MLDELDQKNKTIHQLTHHLHALQSTAHRPGGGGGTREEQLTAEIEREKARMDPAPWETNNVGDRTDRLSATANSTYSAYVHTDAAGVRASHMDDAFARTLTSSLKPYRSEQLVLPSADRERERDREMEIQRQRERDMERRGDEDRSGDAARKSCPSFPGKSNDMEGERGRRGGVENAAKMGSGQRNRDREEERERGSGRSRGGVLSMDRERDGEHHTWTGSGVGVGAPFSSSSFRSRNISPQRDDLYRGSRGVVTHSDSEEEREGGGGVRYGRAGDAMPKQQRGRDIETETETVRERDREGFRSSTKSPYTPSAGSYGRTVIHPWRDQDQGQRQRVGSERGEGEEGGRSVPSSSSRRVRREGGRGDMHSGEDVHRVTQSINFMNDITSYSSLPSEQSLLTADTLLGREREKGERAGTDHAKWSNDRREHGGRGRKGDDEKGRGGGVGKGESRENKGDRYEY